MRHAKELIHVSRHRWEEYLNEENFVREIGAALDSLDATSPKWPAEVIVDEAYYQAQALLMDFGSKKDFKEDYFEEVRQRMGRKVAGAVFAVTYRLLDHFDVLEELRRHIARAVTPAVLTRYLKAIPEKSLYVDFYPRTPYFANSDYVNWRLMTENFWPACVNRILVLARTYEYPQLVAKAILGQLRAFAILHNSQDDMFLQESEELLKPLLTEEQIRQVYAGDFGSKPSALPQAESALRLKESEEYRATIKSMEEQLGRSHISFNKIAECILRLPTTEMQSQALQYVNFLLTGTAWSTKAEEVMNRIFAEVKAHSAKYEVHIGTLNNNGTLNEISGLPKIGL